jgi:hypothetical protein
MTIAIQGKVRESKSKAKFYQCKYRESMGLSELELEV